jgi:hypothetical protein
MGARRKIVIKRNGGIVVYLEKKTWKKNCKILRNGCWKINWTNKFNTRCKDLRKHIQFDGKWERAHRVAYIIFKGKIPKGKEVTHSCDNRWCVNPKHLFAKTHLENMREAFERSIDLPKREKRRIKLLKLRWQDSAFKERHRRIVRAAAKKQWKSMRNRMIRAIRIGVKKRDAKRRSYK